MQVPPRERLDPLPHPLDDLVRRPARGPLRDDALGDGFLASRNDLDHFRKLVAAFDGGARDAGRDPRQLAIGFLQNAWVSPDGQLPDHVERAAWHQLGTYIAWGETDTPDRPYELPPVDQRIVAQRTASGTPDEVVERMRQWIESFAGRDLHAVFRLYYPGMTYAEAAPAVELFAREVIPALKKLA